MTSISSASEEVHGAGRDLVGAGTSTQASSKKLLIKAVKSNKDAEMQRVHFLSFPEANDSSLKASKLALSVTSIGEQPKDLVV